MSNLETRYHALLDEIRAEFPRFRLVRKDQSRFQRAIAMTLRVVTFGAQRRYLTRYTTTLGQSVYVPADWEERTWARRYITMRHERVHLRQFRRWTLPAMAFLYVLVPLPIGLAWCRMRFERPAYEESLRAAIEVHGAAYVKDEEFREDVIDQFVSGQYGWMWPFRGAVERWYDGVVARLTR